MYNIKNSLCVLGIVNNHKFIISINQTNLTLRLNIQQMRKIPVDDNAIAGPDGKLI